VINREINNVVLKMSKQFPVVTITGPRQSGKTTLAKNVFPNKPYVNLENISIRESANYDPIGFLNNFPKGAIIDEVQKVPELISYIQVIVDEVQTNGLFILTGSYQFELMKNVSQSLAGRTALITLLPFSLNETENYNTDNDLDDLIFKGFYPAIYEKKQNPETAYEFYFRTYIERDLRDISKIHNLSLFQKFTKLCAGRIGQILKLSNLANEVGISHTTAKEWLTLLEASYIVYLLKPWHANLNKRLIKSPKLYFYDIGLASFLLGITAKRHLFNHPLRGNLFENLVVLELIKYRLNSGKPDNLFFYRDSKGNEVDIICEIAGTQLPIEIKSGQTVSKDYFKGLNHYSKLVKKLPFGKIIVYSGNRFDKTNNTQILNYKKLIPYLSKLD